MHFLSLLITVMLLNNVCALKILVIFSLPLRSHYMAVKPLFDELAAREHNVTVINNFPDTDHRNNVQYVDLHHNTSSSNRFSPLTYFESMDSRYHHLYNFYRHLNLSPRIVKDDCENLFTNENTNRLLKSGETYDVIFVEQFISDCGLVYAAAHFDAPIIGIMSHVLLPWTYSRLGLPFDYTVDRFYFSNVGQFPPLAKQVESFLLGTFFNTLTKWYIQRHIYEVFNHHLPDFTFDVEELAQKRMKMVFSYQHFSITGGRNLAPQILEIGGVHIRKPKPLSKDVLTFIEASEHGVIYFSLGSNLQASTMSDEKLKAFLNAFERVPQNIILKWENESLPFNNKKFYTSSWFSQLDILCHPKVRAFISHGGMLGTSEAVHCGVPMVAIPFFGDQFSNAAFIKEAGFGRVLNFPDIDEDNLVEALNDVTSESVQRKAKKLSELWHDRPISVMDSAIYWTEYVGRHRTAPPSLPSKRASLYQNILLDGAIITLLISCVIVIYVVFKMCKFLVMYLVAITVYRNKIKVQ